MRSTWTACALACLSLAALTVADQPKGAPKPPPTGKPDEPAARPGKAARAKSNYGALVVKYCTNNLNKKVGGGECSHLANEALRWSGAEFINSKFSKEEGYVWGALVKKLTYQAGGSIVDSSPTSAVQPGDVIQYRDVTFTPSGSAPQHTAIVSAVDAKGNPTEVFTQNFNKKRVVFKDKESLTAIRTGTLWIYRAVAPKVDPKFPVEFSLVNRVNKDVPFTLFGKTYTLTPYDTAGSYVTWYASRTKLTLDGFAYTLKPRTAYEIYSPKGSKNQVRMRPVE
jgi:hypothetical protein